MNYFNMYKIEDIVNKIHCADCLDFMKQMPDKCVDLVITSPPYNLGNGHHTGNTRHSAYDDDLPEVEYQTQQIAVLNELYRIVKDTGSLIYNHKNRINQGKSITPYEWLLKTKWTLKQELVWFNGSQNFDKIRFYPMTERIYWLAKSPDTVLENKINHHDLFKWNAVGTGTTHTRAFPSDLVESFVVCFPQAQIVLDPYMGSGTVARVARDNQRDFIGIEISPEYCKIAEDRLKQQVLNF